MDADTEMRVRAKAQHDFTIRRTNELIDARVAETGGNSTVAFPPAQITIPPARVHNDIHVTPTPVENIVEAPIVQVSVAAMMLGER